MDDLPGNSVRRNPTAKPAPKQKEEAPAPEQVVSGVGVSRRKKPLGRRFKETFFGGDSQSVTDYIVNDVVVPSIKDTIADVVTQAIERSLFGEVRSGSRRGASRYGGHTPYNRYSSSSGERMFGGRPDAPNQNGVTRRGRAMHDFDEIILNSRVEAEEVLDRLVARVEQYEVASVADLYMMLGEKPAFTDQKWGWMDLRDARTSRVRGGYLLDLPRPEPID